MQTVAPKANVVCSNTEISSKSVYSLKRSLKFSDLNNNLMVRQFSAIFSNLKLHQNLLSVLQLFHAHGWTDEVILIVAPRDCERV